MFKRPDNGDLPFELRKGTRVKDSPSGESALFADALWAARTWRLRSAMAQRWWARAWPEPTESVLRLDNVAEAQALCAPLGACAGIMAVERDAGQIRYELRSGAVESRSGVGPSYVKVCSASEPQRRVTRLAVSGQNSLHSFRMGSYDRVDDGSDGKPVFKRSEKDFFIYYRAEDGAWAIGPTPNDPNVWLYAKVQPRPVPDGLCRALEVLRWRELRMGARPRYARGCRPRRGHRHGQRASTRPVSAKTQAKFPPSQDGMWGSHLGAH